MSEAQSRSNTAAPRGRGSQRGRGGSYSSRGSRQARGSNGGSQNGISSDAIDDQGEVGQLMKKYASKLGPLKEMFPNWTPEDIVFALNENQGDAAATAEKISEGFATQWGEVKKKNKNQDRSRSKAKEPSSKDAADSFQSSRPTRGARTSFDGATRGGRGRGGSERGGRGGRGRGGTTNGAPRQSKSRGNDEAESTGGWDSAPVPSGGDAWGADTSDFKREGTTGWGTLEPVEKPAPKVSLSAAAEPPKAAWASLFKTAPPPPAVVQKPATPAPPKPAPEPVEAPKEPEPVEEPPTEVIEVTQPEIEEVAETKEPELPVEVQEPETIESGPTAKLTEDNLEKIDDVAPPAPTGTAASTVATSTEPTEPTPVPAAPIAAPPTPVRQPASKGTPTPRFRRVLDQQEGVVMPANHAEVNRAALQFGSMGLNGDLDDDDEVEQAETVSQPPQPSPIAPVASLPPPTGPSQQLPPSQPAPLAEQTIPTPRQAPGLPSQPQSLPIQSSAQPPLAPQSMTQQIHPQLAAQYGRYGAPEQPQAKPFDSFGHMQQQQASAQPPTQPQAQPQNYAAYMQPQQQPSQLGIGVSSAPEQQYGSYYTERSQPPGFGQQYGSSYMQNQLAQSQQEAGASQQRASSGLSGAADPTQIPSSMSGPGQVQQPTSRYGASAGDQGSGHVTPSPALPIPQTTQPHQQNLAQQTYPNPMQYHPYYQQFMHQNYYSQPNPFGGKNMYGYPQQYMPSGYGDHSSSPGAVSGFGQPTAQGRDSMSSLGDYNRMGTSAAQQSLPQHATAGGYGNGIPNFLGSRGLPHEQQQLGGAGVGQQQIGQQGQGEDMKFGENKPPTGPSSTPGLQGQPGRPGSATSAAGLGPQQGSQGPAGMYGSHLNPALHGQQQQQQAYGVGQGQAAASQYSVYSGGYPSQQYPQATGRHAGAGSGWSYSH